jgi:hypothetical protein
VQLDRIVGGAVVADREQTGRVEGRPAHHRIGIQDAEAGHHEHIAAGGAGIECPQEKLLQCFRRAAVDGAQELQFRRLALPKRDALGA